jgi:hypothetical protein
MNSDLYSPPDSRLELLPKPQVTAPVELSPVMMQAPESGYFQVWSTATLNAIQ